MRPEGGEVPEGPSVEKKMTIQRITNQWLVIPMDMKMGAPIFERQMNGIVTQVISINFVQKRRETITGNIKLSPEQYKENVGNNQHYNVQEEYEHVVHTLLRCVYEYWVL